jgi:hypothetical protein
MSCESAVNVGDWVCLRARRDGSRHVFTQQIAKASSERGYKGCREAGNGSNWHNRRSRDYGWLKDDELYDNRLKRIEDAALNLQTKIGELTKKVETLPNWQTIFLIVAIGGAGLIVSSLWPAFVKLLHGA